MEVEAQSFRSKFSGGSFSGIVKALNGGEKISEKDIEELRDWLDKM